VRTQPRIQDTQPEQAKTAPHAPALGSVTSALRLQRTVGNSAVTVTRSRNGPDTPTPTPGLSPPQPVLNPDEKAFDDAVNSGAWATAATSFAMPSIAASSSISRSAHTTRASRSAANSRLTGRPSGVGSV